MAKRRGHNEGSIRQRPDGLWEARVSLPNGKRKSLYGKTAADVRGKLRAAFKDVDDGVDLSASGRLTIEQYVDRWVAAIKPAVKPRTWQGYESICRVRVVPRIGRKQLAKLTALDLQTLYADLEASGLSARSVHHTHRCLHRAFVQAQRWSLLARNPCDGATAPRPRRTEMRIWTAEQATIFLASVADDPQASALYTLALTTGMRQGELLGLRWSDVELAAGTLRVSQVLHRRKGVPTFDTPKTARSRRAIVLSNRATAALRLHRDRQAFRRRVAGDEWQGGDLVFTNATGGPLDPSWVTGRFKQTVEGGGPPKRRGGHGSGGEQRREDRAGADACRGRDGDSPCAERASLPTIRFHDLRHTAATLLLAQGVHTKVVSEMLGHATVSLTLDVYSHWVPTLHEQAAAAMDAALGA